MQLFLVKSYKVLPPETLGIEAPLVFAPSKEISHEGQGLTAVEKIFKQQCCRRNRGQSFCMPGQMSE